MPKRYLNPMREKFIEEYCNHGDPGLASKNAGYTARNDQEYRRSGMRLKKAMERHIAREMESRMGDKGPRALEVVESLMRSSNSDTVRLAAAKDLLDRSGYKPVERVDISENRSIEEIEARIVGLIGPDAASILLKKQKVDTSLSEEDESDLGVPLDDEVDDACSEHLN